MLATKVIFAFLSFLLYANEDVMSMSMEKPLTDMEYFQSWKSLHQKYYETEEEEIKRLEIFSQTLKKIITHNHKNRSWRKHMGPFSDITEEEFKNLYLMSPQRCSATNGKSINWGRSPPQKKDWRDDGDFVTAVKNQGACGSCWTFSTTGCLEAVTAIHRSDHSLLTLSEQQLVDCAQAFDNNGCEGGLPSHAFEYIKYNKGIVGEYDYPYLGKDEKCQYNPKSVVAIVKDIQNITKGDENEMKNVVGLLNPISVAFDVVSGFKDYKDGVYTSDTCGRKASNVNHAVLAVGYGTTKDGLDYWLIKNSWGPLWGDHGYFKIARGKNMCGLADCASYPIVVSQRNMIPL